MPWEPERNRNSLSPHGIKEAEGHAVHVDVSAGTAMPPPLRGDAPMSMTPHDAGPRDVIKVTPGRMPEHRPPGLLPANGALDPDPHPYTPAAQKQAPNTYGKVRR